MSQEKNMTRKQFQSARHFHLIKRHAIRTLTIDLPVRWAFLEPRFTPQPQPTQGA